MEYAIQKTNFQYEIQPTKASIDEIIKIIESHPWDKELELHHKNQNIDKMFPTIDVQDEIKEGVFFCSYLAKDIFKVSFLDPEKRPKGIIKSSIHRILHPGGDFHIFESCNTENVIYLLKIWDQCTDSELLTKLRENIIKI